LLHHGANTTLEDVDGFNPENLAKHCDNSTIEKILKEEPSQTNAHRR
jgi:hypothetical protein